MNELKVPDIGDELSAAFIEIQQPRSNFALKHFVVGDNHGSSTREYSQVVEELRRAHSSIKRGLLSKKKLEIEKQELAEKGDPISLIDAEMKQIDLDDTVAAIIGKLREFDCLYVIWKTYPKYTHQQLEDGEVEYWKTRLTVQAARDIMSQTTGISVSSQHGMEMGKLAPVPQLHRLIEPVPQLPSE